MESSKILNADVLDIIFDGRNKQYGAYELRKTYNRRLTKALAVMLGLSLVTIATSVLAGADNNAHRAPLLVNDVNLSNVTEKPTPPPVVPPPPKVQPKLAIVPFTPPKIVHEQVTENLPKQDDLDNVNIGPIKQDGIKGDIVGALPEEKGTGVVEAPKVEEDYDKEFKTVQIQAKFPGGAEAWTKFVQRNLRNEVPVDNAAPPGRYSVIVSFLVDKEGNITEVKAETNPGYGTADEAVRVIQRGPKWIPALQNGRNVIYRQRQAVIFEVSEE